MTKDTKEAEDIFGDVKVKGKKASPEREAAPDTPHPLSPEWSDYVLTLFDEKEMIDGKPLVAGLRRVSQLLLGKIVDSRPTQVFAATSLDHPGRATVVFEVRFEDGSVYGDVADCWEGNTDDIFLPFTPATASTRAEARALRKALGLRSVAAEEVTSKDTSKVSKEASRASSAKKPTDGEFGSDLLSDKQDSFIDTLADRAGVDRSKLLSLVFNFDGRGKLTKKVASDVIDLLNSYINQTKDIPEEVLK
jgi:hypothetical protein